MSKLILHIGSAKTGTSSIQKTCRTYRDALAEQGIHWAHAGPAPFNTTSRHSFLSSALRKGEDLWDLNKHRVLQDFKASDCHTCILSDEVLFHSDVAPFAALKSLTEAFDQTEVIVYLRRPDRFVESLWNQHVGEKRREGRNIRKFANSDDIRARLDYAKILDFWSTIGTVKPYVYDTSLGDIVPRFIAQIGYAGNIGETLRSNDSYSLNCGAMLSMMHRFDRGFNQHAMIQAFALDREKNGLGSQLRMRLLQETAPQMERLASNFGITFDTNMPDEPDTPRLYPSQASLALALSRLAPGKLIKQKPEQAKLDN